MASGLRFSVPDPSDPPLLSPSGRLDRRVAQLFFSGGAFVAFVCKAFHFNGIGLLLSA